MEYSIEFHGTLEPPNEISLSSMEFHGTLVRPNEISLRSMEFHGTLRLSFYSISCYPGLPWDIPWNSMELCSRQIKNVLIPWDSMEFGGRHFKWHKNSMEFHGIFHGIPWKPCAAKWIITKFQGIPWNFEILINTMLPWTSMGYSMEFHGTVESPNVKNNEFRVTMELGERHFKWHRCSMAFHGVFHGIPWNCGAAKWNIT